LASIRHVGTARALVFKMDQNGHYTAALNHDYQKYHEEDAVCSILDVMEILGWTFRFQYDSQLSSTKVSGSSFTSREVFIFSS
jgi:hypothetical protein